MALGGFCRAAARSEIGLAELIQNTGRKAWAIVLNGDANARLIPVGSDDNGRLGKVDCIVEEVAQA